MSVSRTPRLSVRSQMRESGRPFARLFASENGKDSPAMNRNVGKTESMK